MRPSAEFYICGVLVVLKRVSSFVTSYICILTTFSLYRKIYVVDYNIFITFLKPVIYFYNLFEVKNIFKYEIF